MSDRRDHIDVRHFHRLHRLSQILPDRRDCRAWAQPDTLVTNLEAESLAGGGNGFWLPSGDGMVVVEVS